MDKKEEKTLRFPPGFLWGAATSAHQVEGGNINDWSEWEKVNAVRLARRAKTYWQSWQRDKFEEMFDEKNYMSGRAVGHYNRYRDDFKMAKSLYHNAHRFSIEWSRIEPGEGKFNKKEIEHYREVLVSLKECGLEPLVSLNHWTLPLWLAKRGGWLSPKISFYFNRYVKLIGEELGGYVKFWITVNEPNQYALNSYLLGVWPPQRRSVSDFFGAINNIVRAHKKAYKTLHALNPDCQVGAVKNQTFFEGGLLKYAAAYFHNRYFLNKTHKYLDFIGLNYYFHNRIKGFKFNHNGQERFSDLGWEIYPEGIYHVLNDLRQYRKPIYVTENGLADKDDKKRSVFIKEHLFWIHKAISEGVDVRGYFYWSLLDNFEWEKGFWPRFGLVEVDHKTMKRIVRPSARQYAEICRNNYLKIFNISNS